jgi:predicted O-methyltransferase YrrM
MKQQEQTWLSYKLSELLDKVDDKSSTIIDLVKARGTEYLENNKRYSELFIDPLSDISQREAQVIQQVEQELKDFLDLILINKTKNVLQIGLGHFGSTHFCLSLICNKVVTIDSCLEFISNYKNREKTYNKNKDIFVYGPSNNKNVIEHASYYGPYDLIFIDANHTYEYVKQDYDNYINILVPGGICAFHDTILTAEQYGVAQFINELRPSKNITDITHSKTTGISYFIKD